MNYKPELKVLGPANLLVLRNGSNGKEGSGADGQCGGANFNCTAAESDD